MPAGINTSEAIEWLAQQRRKPDRQSSKTVLYGEHLLQSGSISKLGDDLWSFLEQLCMAALDLGRWELAEVCISRLSARFPDSPRVASVQGMYLEAKGEPGKALDFYEQILKQDETNMIIAKRKIAALKSLPSNGLEKAVEALVKHLDVFPNDLEGWQELASIYCDLSLFDKAIYALEEMILLFPSNSFFVLQLAETLYTSKQIARSYKTYLQVLEMADSKDSGDAAERPGPLLRALWGLKLCIAQILADSSLATSGECKAENVPEVDALVTGLILNNGYKGDGEGIKATRAAARKILAAA